LVDRLKRVGAWVGTPGGRRANAVLLVWMLAALGWDGVLLVAQYLGPSNGVYLTLTAVVVVRSWFIHHDRRMGFVGNTTRVGIESLRPLTALLLLSGFTTMADWLGLSDGPRNAALVEAATVFSESLRVSMLAAATMWLVPRWRLPMERVLLRLGVGAVLGLAVAWQVDPGLMRGMVELEPLGRVPLLALAEGLVTGMAVQVVALPWRTSSAAQLDFVRESSSERVVLELPACGPHFLAQLVWRATVALVVGTALLALAPWLSPDVGSALVVLTSGGVTVVLALLGIEWAVFAVSSTRVVFTPQVATLTRRFVLPWSTQRVEARDLRPWVVYEADGPFIALSQRAWVCADVPLDRLVPLVDAIRSQTVQETDHDAATAQQAFGRFIDRPKGLFEAEPTRRVAAVLTALPLYPLLIGVLFASFGSLALGIAGAGLVAVLITLSMRRAGRRWWPGGQALTSIHAVADPPTEQEQAAAAPSTTPTEAASRSAASASRE